MVQKKECGKKFVESRDTILGNVTSRIPQYEYRRSWRIPMKINGGESLKHKIGVEIRFQEEICRVDQWSEEIRT